MWSKSLLFGLVCCLLCAVPAVLPAEETGPWYLISETELRSIEEYRKISEAEKLNWLSQVRELKTKAENSESRSEKLEQESASLNSQLSGHRETNRALTESFNRYEQENLTLLSTKNGEIADLREDLSVETVKAEKYKGQRNTVVIIAIALGMAVLGYIAYRVCKFLRIIPI